MAYALVRDVFAAVDQRQDDIAQGCEGEAGSGRDVTGLAGHLSTAAQVNQMQPTPAPRH